MKSSMPGATTDPLRPRWDLRRFPPLREFGEALSPHTVLLSLYALGVEIGRAHV